jgi:hypothetical protein
MATSATLELHNLQVMVTVRPAHYQQSAHGWKAELSNSAQNIVATIPTQVEPVHNSLLSRNHFLDRAI